MGNPDMGGYAPENPKLPEIKIGPLEMKLQQVGDQKTGEYLLKVNGIPFEDGNRGGLISLRSETYDLKTNDLVVAQRIFSAISERLSSHVNEGGSLIGYFRENFVDVLKDIALEESSRQK